MIIQRHCPENRRVPRCGLRIDWGFVIGWLLIMVFTALFWTWLLTALLKPGNPLALFADDLRQIVAGAVR